MNVHKNAKLTRLGRENVVRRWQNGETPKAIAQTDGISDSYCWRTVRWVEDTLIGSGVFRLPGEEEAARNRAKILAAVKF